MHSVLSVSFKVSSQHKENRGAWYGCCYPFVLFDNSKWEACAAPPRPKVKPRRERGGNAFYPQSFKFRSLPKFENKRKTQRILLRQTSRSEGDRDSERSPGHVATARNRSGSRLVWWTMVASCFGEVFHENQGSRFIHSGWAKQCSRPTGRIWNLQKSPDYPKE